MTDENKTDWLKGVLEQAEAISKAFATAIDATVLVTTLAHERGDDLDEKIRLGVREHMKNWLMAYGENYGDNPMHDIDAFLRRAVLEVRNETEFLYGVVEKRKEVAK